jgi:WD40 repeat protein/serine/threonine protein kinase
MSDPTAERSEHFVLLTRLADEFAERYRRGERPALAEYEKRYPHLAAEIREVFPALVEVEQVKEDHEDAQEQATAPPAPALQQLGDFRILREVGKGGMGIVYEAEQVSLGRHVALKVLPKSLLLDSRAKRRFEREAKAAARLHHTNIVPVFGVGEQDGVPYYVMQFIQGLGLDQVLDELKKLRGGSSRSGPFAGGELRVSRKELAPAKLARSLLTGDFVCRDDLPAEEPAVPIEQTVCQEQSRVDGVPWSSSADKDSLASSSVILPDRGQDDNRSKGGKTTYWQSVASIGVQVARALDYAHQQGVQHRDIKPSNLLLDTQARVWVTDFGLAKADDQQNLTNTGDLLGTLRYMPPEAFEGKTDARGDVYALGLTLYELLAFRPAFEEKERNRLIKQVTQAEPARLGKLNPAVPRDLETIVHKAIEREPGRRYPTSADLACDLQRFLDDEPIQARRASLLERSWRWCKRNPMVAGLTAAVFVLLAAVAVVASVGYLQAQGALHREASEHEAAERERGRAETNLYHSLVREAQATRRVRDNGYRQVVWDRLQQALALETPDKDPVQLRQEAVACLGDFVGLTPRTWSDLTSSIRALEVHPDGRQVAIALDDGTLLLRDLATGTDIARLQDHKAPIASLSFAAAADRLASTDFSGIVKVWQANRGSGWVCMRSIPLERPTINTGLGTVGPYATILGVLSPDGESLFTYSPPQRTITHWQLSDGSRTRSFDLPGSGRLYGLAVSPDGKLLAAAYNTGEEHRLLVWEVATRALVHNAASDLGTIFDVAFSGRGHYLAYTGSEGGAVLAVPNLGRVNLARFGPAVSVGFSPDDRLVAFAHGQLGAVRLWEMATNREVAVLKFPRTHVVRFAKHGEALLAAGYFTPLRIWDLAAAEEKVELQAHVGGIPSVAFHPQGKLLASAGKDRTVRIWDPSTGRRLRALTGFRAEVETVAFSPDGSLLATGDYAGGIRFWELPSWQELPVPRHPLGPRIWACAFSPDSRLFAACGEGGIVLWKVAPRTPGGRCDPGPWMQQVARPSVAAIAGLSWSGDGKLLAWVTSHGLRLHFWDVANARPYPFPSLQANSVPRSVVLSHDGKYLVFIRQGGVPEVWDVAARQRVYPAGPKDFEGASERGFAAILTLSPSDAWLAVQGAQGSASVWDLHQRKLLLALPEEGFVWGLAWSPDRKLLATGLSDGRLALWNIPRIRARLAEIGLDWQDPPSPAAHSEPVQAGRWPPPIESARLFSLEQYGTAKATLGIEGNVCRIDVSAVDGVNWHVRISQALEDLQQGATYTLRFRAKADAPREIFLCAQIDEQDWHSIGLWENVPLTEKWQDYRYQFQAKDFGAENMIRFTAGERIGTVWIADFRLTKNAK